MFSKKPSIKILKETTYYRQTNENEFPIKNYITETYGYVPSYFFPEDTFSSDTLDFLIENGQLMSFSTNGYLKHVLVDIKDNFRSGSFWFSYKDIFIKITVKNESYNTSDDTMFFNDGSSAMMNEIFSNKKKGKAKIQTKKTYSLLFCAPSDVNNYHLSDFEKFVMVDDEESKVHLFIKNQFGEYTFEPIAVNLPKELDLELNYGKRFLDVDKKIKERLVEKTNGLYMFHGPPGTGKTTYIKYLASCVDRDFIYIPTTMIEYFTSDPNCLHTLIQKPNSIIILEDAEKAILKRMGDGMDSSAVSSLLNLSDGILSDILKTSVIVTYNCPKQDIDDALKRKGRLQVEYEFDALSVEDATKLAKKLKFPKKFIEDKIKDPMSLSDVYNLEKEVEFYSKEKKTKEQPRIGFN